MQQGASRANASTRRRSGLRSQDPLGRGHENRLQTTRPTGIRRPSVKAARGPFRPTDPMPALPPSPPTSCHPWPATPGGSCRPSSRGPSPAAPTGVIPPASGRPPSRLTGLSSEQARTRGEENEDQQKPAHLDVHFSALSTRFPYWNRRRIDSRYNRNGGRLLHGSWTLRFEEIIWKHQFLEKIIQKHQLYPSEVEEVLRGKPFTRRQERGRRPGQDLYSVYGRTDAGRYIVVFVIRKAPRVALPISARDMTPSERAYYAAQRPRA